MKRLLALLFMCSLPLWGGERVVLIHGFLSSAKSMRDVGCAVRCVGFEPYPFEFDSRKYTICRLSSQLVATLQALAAERPGEPISFATHSIGALILRTALNDPCCPPEAKAGSAVLFAPPNQGSSLARSFRDSFLIRLLMGDKSGAQLMCYTGEEWACFTGPFPSCMPVLVIAGYRGTHLWFNGAPNDRFLTLDETALPTPYCYYSFPLSHGALLTNPCALCLTRNFFLSPGCSH